MRAYEEGGEPRGDEARPEPRLQPRRRGVFTSRKDGARRGRAGGDEGGGGAGAEAATGGGASAPGADPRYTVAGKRGVARQRDRIERKNARRAERVGAAAAGREAGVLRG